MTNSTSVIQTEAILTLITSIMNLMILIVMAVFKMKKKMGWQHST